MKIILTITLISFFSMFSFAQTLIISEANGVKNLNHKDNIGTIMRTDVLKIKGTYDTNEVESISLHLLSFQKTTWSKVDDYSVTIVDKEKSSLTGSFDSSITVPEDYLLGDSNTTQMLQVSVNRTSGREFLNLYVTVVEKSEPSVPKTIDFDTQYGYASGAELLENITSAINEAMEGDTLVFAHSEYDFGGKSFSISKPIIFSGIVPNSIPQETVGAVNVKTIFKDVKGVRIRSDNVALCNLKLVPSENVGYSFVNLSHGTEGKHYMGISLNNVIIEKGRVQVYGGNGAGIHFTNVSLLEFTQGGYYLNRKWSIDDAPQFVMQNCHIKPDFEAVNFNVRAISLDAGNTEYPVVWNQNNSLIDNCYIDGTGLGISSKCSYVNVTNCHFIGYRSDIDMIHIEEFGHHFIIDGNTFEHNKPARGINIDREIQQSHDIQITNNTWIGTYSWVISAHSPFNVRIENNDFTQAQAKSSSDKTFDFTYDHGEETTRTAYNLPCSSISFKNNKGLSNKHGIFAYKALKNDTSNDIDYPVSKIEFTPIEKAPIEIIDCTKQYRIKNKKTGKYLCAKNGETELVMKASEWANNGSVWEFEFEYPYYYYIKNVDTQNYVEVYRGYTMGDYDNETAEQIVLKQSNFYANKLEKPRWYLRAHPTNTQPFYELIPGGNEHKSRVVQVDNTPELEYALVNNRALLDPEDDCSWILEEQVPLNNKSVNINETKEAYVFPGPTKEMMFLQFIEPTTEDIKLTIFSIKGRKVDSVKVKKGTRKLSINVQSYVAGVYLLKIKGSTTASTIKFIVNN